MVYLWFLIMFPLFQIKTSKFNFTFILDETFYLQKIFTF